MRGGISTTKRQLFQREKQGMVTYSPIQPILAIATVGSSLIFDVLIRTFAFFSSKSYAP